MKKILLVDDDKAILEALNIAISCEGYEVESTPYADEVEQKIKEFSPDLILLDILLAGQDGRLICRKLKENSKTKHIPIILISAHQKVGDTILEYGADDFIGKPFDLTDLMAKITKYL